MSVFDNYFFKKDSGVRRRIEIDISLYEKLDYLSNTVYDASVNKLVNVAIIELIKSKDIKVYERYNKEKTEPHNFLIRESSYRELEELKKIYGLSIFKLVNIAIFNVLKNE